MKILLLAIFVFLSCGTTPINPELNKMNITFYNVLEGVLPASPGAALSTINLSSPVGYGDYFGIFSPQKISPAAAPLALGCSDNSNALITRYKYDFIGATGARPGLITEPISLEIGWVGRTVSNSALPVLPFVDDQWQDISLEFKKVVPFIAPSKTPSLFPGPKQIDLDTRNLLPGYYGSTFYMRIILNVECVGVGL